jgi:hypothetical protein
MRRFDLGRFCFLESDGKLERWKDGRLPALRILLWQEKEGKAEGWNDGRLENWKVGKNKNSKE